MGEQNWKVAALEKGNNDASSQNTHFLRVDCFRIWNTPLKLSSVHNGRTFGLLDLSLGLMLSYLSLPHARNR